MPRGLWSIPGTQGFRAEGEVGTSPDRLGEEPLVEDGLSEERGKNRLGRVGEEDGEEVSLSVDLLVLDRRKKLVIVGFLRDGEDEAEEVDEFKASGLGEGKPNSEVLTSVFQGSRLPADGLREKNLGAESEGGGEPKGEGPSAE